MPSNDNSFTFRELRRGRYFCQGPSTVSVTITLQPSGTVVYTGSPWPGAKDFDVPDDQSISLSLTGF